MLLPSFIRGRILFCGPLLVFNWSNFHSQSRRRSAAGQRDEREREDEFRYRFARGCIVRQDGGCALPAGEPNGFEYQGLEK